MLVSAIKTAVTDYLTTETISDEKMARLIAAAVRFYSNYNPVYKRHTFTTTPDERLYDLPSDCVMVFNVDYWLSEITSTINDDSYIRGETSVLTDDSYDLFSERIIRDIKRQELITRVRGQWEIENKKLALYPVPSSAMEVSIDYGALHSLSSGNYATIPDEDLDIMRDLTLAEILSSRMIEVSIEPDYAEGLQRITKRFIPENAAEVIARLRSKCTMKYSKPAVMV